MAMTATKARASVFYQARMRARKADDRLRSRELAADVIGIDRTRLARIELGSIEPYPEEVRLLSDVYGAPELENYFCCERCALARNHQAAETDDIAVLTIRLLKTAKGLGDIEAELLQIAEDGKVTADEEEALIRVTQELESIATRSNEASLILRRLQHEKRKRP